MKAQFNANSRVLDQHRITDILPTPVAEFERMIRDGELEDGFLLMAYVLAKAKNLNLASGEAS